MKYLITVILISLCLIGCQQDPNKIIVGTIAGPETTLMEVAQAVAKKKYNLNITIKTFSDYVIPNIALNDGSIDANVFQHQPYLDATIKARGYELISIGKTFIYPMAIYSNKIKSISELKPNASVAIPNDPSNEARALRLLEKAGLISLTMKDEISLLDIKTNPLHLTFKTLTAPQLSRSLSDVDMAVINSNYAVVNNLTPQKDGIYMEAKDSPYANIIVVQKKNKENAHLKLLVKSLNSKEVLAKAQALFKNGAALPAW